jgi:hypothetical protein
MRSEEVVEVSGHPGVAASGPTVIVLSKAVLRRLHRHLLRRDGREYMAYAFCRAVEDRPEAFRVTELLPAVGADYLSHGPGHIRLHGDFQAAAKSRCRTLQPDAVIQVHSHPFSCEGRFSPIDDLDFPEVAYDFGNARPGIRCGRWVWGRRLHRSRLEMGVAGNRDVRLLRQAGLRLDSRAAQEADGRGPRGRLPAAR